MTTRHRDAVLELAPRQLRRTFTLTEASLLIANCEPQNLADLAAVRSQLPARNVADIADPIGQDAAFFAEVGALIAEQLPTVIEFCHRSSAPGVN
ncbi:hypothetical protein MSZK_32270 [Mycobacterium sp. shizuoka-1]|nr:hypothetical protein MSZK_32270 [Mycobacterium sp. shizuoka-1]